MIEVQSPIIIKSKLGTTIHITVQHEDGQVYIETYARHGKHRYRLSRSAQDGKLIEEPAH